MNRLSADKRQQIVALLQAGHSDLGIQRRVGVSRATANRYRKQLGLPGYRTTESSPACRHGHPFPENAARDNNGWLYCRECRRACARARYQPAQPDEIAIVRAVAGDPPDRLTPRERTAAIVRLEVRSLSARVIAERVHCNPRTVHRARSESREVVAA
ncbi:helix-turn-helix domain-containing protein [Streptomyces sp. NPDC058001]|uniref:helix-turn-helix domain-containing protein n=1 Tax=Streptomyces sp. NPDC058001 TaxID=3346300 RepID=UPI0036EC24EF